MLDVLIVGCGNIAGRIDESRAEGSPPLSHAGAFKAHGGFRLVGCIDPDADRRSAFAAAWDCPVALASFEDWHDNVDVVSICTPTHLHEAGILAAVKLKPALLFCEKPLTHSLASTAAVVETCERSNVLLCVNYTRRWAPDITELRKSMADGRWGALRSITGYYSKGILNNGSHLIDLLAYLGVSGLQPVGPALARADHDPDDPTLSILVASERGVPVHLVGGDCRDFARFEVELQFERAVVVMEQGGFSWRFRTPANSEQFEGYSILSDAQIVPGRYAEAMANAVSNIHSAVTGSEDLHSTGRTALHALAICDDLCRAVISENPPQ